MTEIPPVIPEPPAAEAADERRGRWRAFFFGAAVLVIAVGALLVFRQWPPLTLEERTHLGTWYGYIHEGDRHYCWIAEIRRDKTCRIAFRHFEELLYLGAPPESAVMSAGDIQDSIGTWAIQGTTYSTTTRYPQREPSLWERLRTWISVRYWPPRVSETYEYQIEASPPDHFVYAYGAGGITFHAVRVPDGFALPDEPLTVTDALAQVAARTALEKAPP